MTRPTWNWASSALDLASEGFFRPSARTIEREASQQATKLRPTPPSRMCHEEISIDV